MDLLDQDIDILATQDVLTIDQNETIGYGILTMINNRLRRLPVVNADDQLVGIVTSTDILNALDQVNSIEFMQRKVKDFMSKEVISVKKNTKIGEALHIMYNSGVSCVPLVETQKVTGIFTNKDILLSNVLWREVPNMQVIDPKAPGHLIQDDDKIIELSSIRETAAKLVKTGRKYLLVVGDDSEIIGAISVKNILRTLVSYLILQGTNVEYLDSIKLKKVVKDPLMRQKETATISDIRNWMIARSTEIVPLIDAEETIIKTVSELEMIKYLIEHLDLSAFGDSSS